MGAHGIKTFNDDDGADFAADVLGTDNMDIVVRALRAVPDADWEYVENPECLRALVSAEIVAAQLDHEPGDLQDDLFEWATQFMEPSQELTSLANRAVARILRNSETRDLWKDTKHFDDWVAKTNYLAKRLS